MNEEWNYLYSHCAKIIKHIYDCPQRLDKLFVVVVVLVKNQLVRQFLTSDVYIVIILCLANNDKNVMTYKLMYEHLICVFERMCV